MAAKTLTEKVVELDDRMTKLEIELSTRIQQLENKFDDLRNVVMENISTQREEVVKLVNETESNKEKRKNVLLRVIKSLKSE